MGCSNLNIKDWRNESLEKTEPIGVASLTLSDYTKMTTHTSLTNDTLPATPKTANNSFKSQSHASIMMLERTYMTNRECIIIYKIKLSRTNGNSTFLECLVRMLDIKKVQLYIGIMRLCMYVSGKGCGSLIISIHRFLMVALW